MRIGIVGGVERNEAAYRDLAERAGHQLEFHPGHMAGRGVTTLENLVAAVDLLLVVTDVNSHGAVQMARKLARKHRVPMLLQRRYSVSRFGALMDTLGSSSLDAIAQVA